MKNSILDRLKEEREMRLKGCLYHYTQIKFAYNTNRIEGSELSEDQTRYIYETHTISTGNNETASVNDIIETVNHFSCFDYLLKIAEEPLSEEIIKEFHGILKRGSMDSFKDWFKAGDYKTRKNYIGGKETALPSEVGKSMKKLLSEYSKEDIDINKIIDFHYNFEKIHPFQDGNGRVGRLIMFKECLKNNIVPFIIENKDKQFYYEGLKEYPESKLRLVDTCLYSQDVYKDVMKYLEVDYARDKKEEKKGDIKRDRIKEMECYKYDEQTEELIDVKNKKLEVKRTEVISEKENLCKLSCKNSEGKDVFVLQRISGKKTERWYFKENFNVDSAVNFLYFFGKNKEREKKNSINRGRK